MKREPGASPGRYSHCEGERFGMPLGNWEGKTSDEAEPEELPDFDAIKFLRLMGLRNYLTPFCIYMQKSVLFCFKGKSF